MLVLQGLPGCSLYLSEGCDTTWDLQGDIESVEPVMVSSLVAYKLDIHLMWVTCSDLHTAEFVSSSTPI